MSSNKVDELVYPSSMGDDLFEVVGQMDTMVNKSLAIIVEGRAVDSAEFSELLIELDKQIQQAAKILHPSEHFLQRATKV